MSDKDLIRIQTVKSINIIMIYVCQKNEVKSIASTMTS